MIDEEISSSLGDLIALDLVLQKLEREHADKFEIVMLRYFAGPSVPEVADVLRPSWATVQRRWRLCRPGLARELGAGSRRSMDGVVGDFSCSSIEQPNLDTRLQPDQGWMTTSPLQLALTIRANVDYPG